MQQNFEKFLMFRNRLEKVYRHRSKQAKRLGVSCYRVYDHDVPEFPLMIEVYGTNLYVAEYKRNHQLSEEEHGDWWQRSKEIIALATQIGEENLFQKLRKRKESRLDQYQKRDEIKQEFVVAENGLKFIINLSDYLDTGLFLDHRVTRDIIRKEAKDKRVLNLFCYTGSFSVYAVAGGASKVTSVDLSKTYLDWTERNLKLNFDGALVHEAVHADVVRYLKGLSKESYDLIILDPPTFSNSKRMEDILDIQRDHVELINDCLAALSENGLLYFSTNFRQFHLDSNRLHSSNSKDITKITTPFDFTGKLERQCFMILK